MGQHDFDKQFNRLKEREIKPSVESWDKLRGKLDTGKVRSQNKFWLMGIAASLVVGLIVGSLIFSEGQTLITEPRVVENPATSQPAESFPDIFSEEAIAVQESDEQIKEERTEIQKTENRTVLPEKQTDMIALAEERKEQTFSQSTNVAESTNGETGSIGESEVQIAAMASGEKRIEVTDEEINNLLRIATLELSAENSEVIAGKISAENLLQDVENELEQGFRRRVLEILQEGFSKARTAVANRNH